MPKLVLLCLLSAFLSANTARATISSQVHGVVHDPQHRPIAGAHIELHAAHSAFTQATVTANDGSFTIPSIPLGDYLLTISQSGFSTAKPTPPPAPEPSPILHIELQLSTVEQTTTVITNATAANIDTVTPTTLISRNDIAQTPGASRTNSMAMITDYVPGAYMTHDMLHMRGGHQVSWLIDGIQIPNTNIASNIAAQIDPKDIDYLETQRGSYTSDVGDRTYGVFNVVPRSGFERSRQAELVASYGTYNSTDDQLSFGDHNDRGAYYFSVNGNRSDYGLAPPTSKVLHDQVAGGGAFTSLILNVNPDNQLRFVGAARNDYFQVPNGPDDQANGVRDREREQDIFANFTWVHTFGPGMVFTASPFIHSNRAAFEGGPQDVPSSTNNRFSFFGGAEASVNVVRGQHNFKAGFSGFGQQDSTLVGVIANDGSGLALSQRERESGSVTALYVEDQYKVTTWLSVNCGIRFTHFAGRLKENVGSPRLGATIQIPRLKWILRGTYSRFYQAPPLNTVSGPLLDFAAGQGLGFLPLHGDRD